MRVLAIVLLVICSTRIGLTQDITWERTNGPEGGMVNGLAANSHGTLYATVDNGFKGGLYALDLGTMRWREVEIPFSEARMGKFVINRSGNFYCQGYLATYRSFSGERGWESFPAQGVVSLVQDSVGNLYGISQYNNRSLRSTDWGETWQEIPGALDYIYGIAVTEQNVVVGLSQRSCYMLNEKGEWTRTQVQLPFAGFLLVAHKNRLLATGYPDSAVAISLDTGRTWTQNKMPFLASSIFVSPQGRIFSQKVLPSNPSGVFYFSDNNGSTWSPAPNVRGPLTAADGRLFQYYSSHVYVSSDEGFTWSLAETGLALSAPSKIVALDSLGILAVSAEQLCMSSDRGNKWSRLLPENRVRCVETLPQRKLLAGTDRGLYLSEDAGNTWSLRSSDTLAISSLSVTRSGEILCGLDSGGLFSTSDVGVTWSKYVQKFARTPVQSFVRTPRGSLLLYAYPGNLRSTDNGLTWTNKFGGGRPTSYLVYRDSLIFGFSGTLIYTSTTDGEFFSPSEAKGRWLAVAGDTCYIASSAGVFSLPTLDANPRPFGENLQGSDVTSIAIDSSGYVYAGTAGFGVYRSSKPVPLTATASDTTTTDDPDDDPGGPGDDDDDPPKPVDEYGFAQFPNPTTSTTTLQFNLKQEARVTLNMYNDVGMKMRTVVDELRPSGNQAIVIDHASLTNGVYFYELWLGNRPLRGVIHLVRDK